MIATLLHQVHRDRAIRGDLGPRASTHRDDRLRIGYGEPIEHLDQGGPDVVAIGRLFRRGDQKFARRRVLPGLNADPRHHQQGWHVAGIVLKYVGQCRMGTADVACCQEPLRRLEPGRCYCGLPGV